ncbi:histidine kinase [Hyphococcus flavus]|uniref:Histidine kinase n=1 Tax=Hyphococcus flavus TaxID=1866326 RepID=A0AAE9ZBT6_9PROT|nr:histidine kinase [Hyphococcus flavus]WDI31336.1 histidine kinase [Hyphococcus flavus]
MSSADVTASAAGPFITTQGRSREWMNWFFADKGRMFWILQVAGWMGFFALHILSVSTFVAGRSTDSLLYSVASSLIGFLTTSILARPIYRFARRQGPAVLLLIVLTSTILMAVAMSAMKAQTFGILFGNAWMDLRGASLGTTNYLLLIVPDLPVNLFLLGSWAGFYFGINYYLKLRNEMERAILSARLADQAQLKMLRYQLNPHFLFNTLNAISTLVLEQDGKQANSMLTQLSAFLRYSLDSDPLQKTTLAEEVRALDLYLAIEKTRFGDRLTVTFDIDEETKNAYVPSLILQPAIENAIKYAIAQMESGGEITIIAKREGGALIMQVCDNGPNAPEDPEALLRDVKTGVGLVNMRDRLNYLYQGRGKFMLSHVEPQGLCVGLRIPFENRG